MKLRIKTYRKCTSHRDHSEDLLHASTFPDMLSLLLTCHLLFTYYVICWIVEVSSVWIAAEEFKKFESLQLLFNSFKQMHPLCFARATLSLLYCNSTEMNHFEPIINHV